MESTRVTEVRIERRRDRNVADTPTPRLSWTTTSGVPGWRQVSAQIRLDGQQTVDVDGSHSTFVAWPFPSLAPHARHSLEVRVTGADGHRSDWSEPVTLQSGFLAPGAWHADLIGLQDPGEVAQPGLMRREYDVTKDVETATLYATAHGVYQVAINGRDVDDSVLKPGWTSYQYRLEHEATDVTELLRKGRNAIGIRCGGGWFTEQYGFDGAARRVYGEQPAVAVQVHLVYTDGTEQVLASGSTLDASSWTSGRTSSVGSG